MCLNGVALPPHGVCLRLDATGCLRRPLLLRRGSTVLRLGFFRHLRGVDCSKLGSLGSHLLYRRLRKVDHVTNGWRRPLGSSFPVLCVFSCLSCIADMVAVVVGRGALIVAGGGMNKGVVL